MLRDYSAKTTQVPRQKAGSKTALARFALIQWRLLQWLVVITLLGLLVFVGFRSWQLRHSLQHNKRVLLVRQQQPVAILLFQVEQQQLLLSDLSQVDFDRWQLQQALEASVAADRSHLLYNLLFTTNFDQVLEYSETNFDRESLLQAFASQQPYYFFLKNGALIREQAPTTAVTLLGEQVFDCPVALINTTGEVGLATTWAEILQNSSFSVIKKTDNQDNLARTQVVYDPGQTACQGLVDRLRQTVPGLEVVQSQAQAATHRAALAIYLGRDLADLYVFFVDLFHR